MKSLLFFILLALQIRSFGQITFEDLTGPVDFNILAVRKSNAGEYFTQAVNDPNSIYTSPDGQTWSKSHLPTIHYLDEIQFFSDGTPLLTGEDEEHLVRRNGTWHILDPAGSEEVEASFIRNDSLFVFYNQTIAFSVDKGETFTPVVTINIGNTRNVNLWKFENVFVLHYESGGSDYLSVYKTTGERILFKTLDLFPATFTYSSCGQILIHDLNNYGLLKEDGLTWQTGDVSEIFPANVIHPDLASSDEDYYLRDRDTLYKSNGCNFLWEPVATNNYISDKLFFWVSPDGDVLLSDYVANSFVEHPHESDVWETYKPDINYAFVVALDESAKGHQVTATSNALFYKNTGTSGWEKNEAAGNSILQVQYAPDGDLYINRGTDILYSTDNGTGFSVIEIPDNFLHRKDYTMTVLDDNVLFIVNRLWSESYYSLNNGQEWIPVPVSFHLEIPIAKLVNRDLLLAELNYNYVVTRINIDTKEVTNIDLGEFYNVDDNNDVILDDGTIYFNAYDVNGSLPGGLYRYKFGEELEFIDSFEEPDFVYSWDAAGQNVYAFSSHEYHVFNGETMETYPYAGLPANGQKKFIISSNDYVYVIIDDHFIYRSGSPLQHSVSTKEPVDRIEFELYPNPVDHVLSLDISAGAKDRIDSYEIMDMQGRLSLRSAYDEGNGIPVDLLSPGFYNLVLLEKGAVIGIQKFVKN